MPSKWDASLAAITIGRWRARMKAAELAAIETNDSQVILEKTIVAYEETPLLVALLYAAGSHIADLEHDLARARLANYPRKWLQWLRRFW